MLDNLWKIRELHSQKLFLPEIGTHFKKFSLYPDKSEIMRNLQV